MANATYETEVRFGSGANYAETKDDGEINLHGTARVIQHLDLNPERFKLPATNYPAWGFEGIFQTLDFDPSTDESAYAEDHLDFDWDDTTDIEVEIDWLHDNVDNGVVVWGIEYKSIKSGEVVGGPGTTMTQPSAGNHTAGELVTTTFTSKISHMNLEADDILAVRLFRDASSDNLAEDARFVEAHFHITKNKLGEAT